MSTTPCGTDKVRVNSEDLLDHSKVIDLLVRSEKRLNLERLGSPFSVPDSELLADLRKFLGYPIAVCEENVK